MANFSDGYRDNRQRGFTFLELIVVMTIISILGVFALNRYHKLLVDVERTSMEHDLGVMRSAISMQVAGHYVAGNMDGLVQLIGSNPMDLLAEKPSNYMGVMRQSQIGKSDKGRWFYDSKDGVLIYTVRNQLYFETQLDPPVRARFRIYPVYSERSESANKYLSGLTLQPLETFRWLRPWG